MPTPQRPIAGRWSDDEKIWVAAGFGGHGLPPALAIGRELAASIQTGNTSDKMKLLDPARFGRDAAVPQAEIGKLP